MQSRSSIRSYKAQYSLLLILAHTVLRILSILLHFLSTPYYFSMLLLNQFLYILIYLYCTFIFGVRNGGAILLT